MQTLPELAGLLGSGPRPGYAAAKAAPSSDETRRRVSESAAMACQLRESSCAKKDHVLRGQGIAENRPRRRKSWALPRYTLQRKGMHSVVV